MRRRPTGASVARARLVAAMRAHIAEWPTLYAPRLVNATPAEAAALFDELEARFDALLLQEAARLGIVLDTDRPPLRLLS